MGIEQQVREAVDTFMMRVRRDLDAHLRMVTSDLLRYAHEAEDTSRMDLERAVAEARADAERSFRLRLEAVRAELTQEMEVRLSAERAELASARVDPRVTHREARVDTLERLLGAIRRLDEATSLTGILEALTKGTAAETSRVAVLIVDGDMLKTWAQSGFADDVAPRSVAIGQSGVLAAAVALRQTSFVPPALEAREPTTPPFMRVPVGHTGLVTPIVVAGEVVAVLYADDLDRQAAQEDVPIWTEEVELLARHAALRLENLTSERTVEVLTRPA